MPKKTQARISGFLEGIFWIFKSLFSQASMVKIKLASCRHHFFLRPKTSDWLVFGQVFVTRHLDMSFLDLKPSLIVDAGANVGYSTIFFAETYPSSRILALEPEDSNFEMLLKNTRAYENVKPIKAALWKKRARLKIENPDAKKWAFRVRRSDTTLSEEVQGITVMDLLKLSSAERIDILKIDIEGAEKELFDWSCEQWLDRVNLIIIELHDRIRKGCSRAVFDATSHYNFLRFSRFGNLILLNRYPRWQK